MTRYLANLKLISALLAIIYQFTSFTIITEADVNTPSQKNVWIKNVNLSTNTLNAVATNGKDQYVTVGNDGTILFSNDGQKWRHISIPNTSNMNDIIYRNGSFIAIGTNGTILTSSDGQEWESVNYKIDYSLKDICNINAVVYKNQQINWDKKLLPNELFLNKIIWDGKQYIILLNINHNTGFSEGHFRFVEKTAILTSLNGVDWKLASINLPDNEKYIKSAKLRTNQVVYFYLNYRSISYGNGRYILVGSSSNVAISEDIINWNLKKSNVYCNFNDVASNGKTFIAVGWDGRLGTSSSKQRMTGIVLSSSDGVNWIERKMNKPWYPSLEEWQRENLDKPNGLYDLEGANIVWSGERFILTTNKGVVSQSVDGINWSLEKVRNRNSAYYNFWFMNFIENVGTDADIKDVTWDGHQYIAVGSRGTILTSNDCIIWTPVTPETGTDFFDIALVDGKYYVVGNYGRILTSIDFETWEQEVIKGFDCAATEYADEFNNNLFIRDIISHENTTIFLAEDFLTTYKILYKAPGEEVWSQTLVDRKFYNSNDKFNISWEGSSFITRNSEYELTSESGVNWAPKLSKENKGYFNNTNNGNTFYSLKNRSFLGTTILKSNNNNDWSPSYVSTDTLNAIACNNNTAVAIGMKGKIVTRVGDNQWTYVKTNETFNLNDIAWTGKEYIVIGEEGLILTSIDGLQWKRAYSGTLNTLNRIKIINNDIFIVGNNSTLLKTDINNMTFGLNNSIPINNNNKKSVVKFNSRNIGAAHDSDEVKEISVKLKDLNAELAKSNFYLEGLNGKFNNNNTIKIYKKIHNSKTKKYQNKYLGYINWNTVTSKITYQTGNNSIGELDWAYDQTQFYNEIGDINISLAMIEHVLPLDYKTTSKEIIIRTFDFNY